MGIDKVRRMSLDNLIKERIRKLNAGEIKCGNTFYMFPAWQNAVVLVTLIKKNGVWDLKKIG